MNEPMLHIYAQEIWHGDAFILGNKEALESLRAAIDAAFMKGRA